MKRYQCVKAMPPRFKIGSIYAAIEIMKGGTVQFPGACYVSPDDMQKHFRELEPVEELPIPNAYHDQEAEEYLLLQPDTGTLRGCAWGCAILFALFAAGMYIIALIERP